MVEVDKEVIISELVSKLIQESRIDKEYLKKEYEEEKNKNNNILSQRVEERIDMINERMNKITLVVSRLCDKFEKLNYYLEKDNVKNKINNNLNKKEILSDNQLKVFNTCKENKNKSRSEIAEMLGLTIPSLNMQLSRIRAKGYKFD